MSRRPILLYPDPILRRRAAPVERFDADLARLIADLRETMYDAPGVGLAAPQIGEAWRVAVIDVDPRGADSKLHVLVNPRIVESDGEATEIEGCLSIPEFTEKVDRPARVRVAAQDATASRSSWTPRDSSRARSVTRSIISTGFCSSTG